MTIRLRFWRQSRPGALEAAKIFVRAPMLALDVAKASLSVAEVVVDKSRMVLAVAEGALDFAVLWLEGAKFVLDAAKLALEALKHVLGAAVKVFEFVVEYGMKNSIDVRNCGFDIQLSTKDIPVFEVFCEVNPFRLGWVNVSVKINFRNILQSIWSAAVSTMKSIIKMFGHTGMLIGRRKRDIEYDITKDIHHLIRKVRQAGSSSNFSTTLLNDTIHASYEFERYNITDTTTDYDDRVALFAANCELITQHIQFLRDTVELLLDAANTTKTSIDAADAIAKDRYNFNGANTSNHELIFQFANISIDYGSHYNLTKDDIENAVADALNKTEDDGFLIEASEMISLSQNATDAELENIKGIDFGSEWMVFLENITFSHYNTTQCVDFRDCVLFCLSEMYELFEIEDHANKTALKYVLLDLETDLLNVTQNDTIGLDGLYETTVAIRQNIGLLEDLNVYCSKPPTFTTPLFNAGTVIGQAATFYCNGEADPEPEYWWIKGNDTINFEWSRILHIANVTEADVDAYQCVIGNVVGNLTSNEAYIILVPESQGLLTYWKYYILLME